eukprot:3130002-Amphidinium_carterae.1
MGAKGARSPPVRRLGLRVGARYVVLGSGDGAQSEKVARAAEKKKTKKMLETRSPPFPETQKGTRPKTRPGSHVLQDLCSVLGTAPISAARFLGRRPSFVPRERCCPVLGSAPFCLCVLGSRVGALRLPPPLQGVPFRARVLAVPPWAG